MNNFGFLFLLFFVLQFLLLNGVNAASVYFSSTKPTQGDTVVIKVRDEKLVPVYASFADTKSNFFKKGKEYIAFLGIKITNPVGLQNVLISFNDGSKIVKPLSVQRKKIIREVISFEGGPSPKDLVEKISEENRIINEIVGFSSFRYFDGKYGLPLLDNTKITDHFGILRKIGDREVWHLGVDFGAKEGASVWAINNGIVKFASSTLSYGNTVIIDHGNGVFSLYLHLKDIVVRPGAIVKKGEIIGYAGKTGFTTGSHLHLSVKVNGVSVDPIRFVNLVNREFKY